MSCFVSAEPTDAWLKYAGTVGKPCGKRRKQTSAPSIVRNRFTQLQQFLVGRVKRCLLGGIIMFQGLMQKRS